MSAVTLTSPIMMYLESHLSFAFINLLFLLSVSITVKLLKMYVKLVPASSQAAFSTGQWASLWTPRDQKSEPDSLKGWVYSFQFKDWSAGARYTLLNCLLLVHGLIVMVVYICLSFPERHGWGRTEEGKYDQSDLRRFFHGELRWRNTLAGLQEHHQCGWSGQQGLYWWWTHFSPGPGDWWVMDLPW